MKNKLLLDAFFYLGVPLLMWNLFRESLGDYHTILYGMLPAVIYTIVVAFINKEWNVTGIFFLSIISMNFLFNLLSKTAEQELWNGVYMSVISFSFYVLTIVIKKPIGMYFFIDYAFAKGIPRKVSKELYSSSNNFHYFVEFTLFLMVICIVLNAETPLLKIRKDLIAPTTTSLTIRKSVNSIQYK